MAQQAPTLVSGRLLLESATIVLAALTVLCAFAIKTEAGRSCAVPFAALASASLSAAPTRPVTASDPAPETLFRDALLLGD